MVIKAPFSLILCCCLLASVLFIPYGIVGRRLEEVKEDDNGQSKAGVTKSHANTAPSWVGNVSPPTSNRNAEEAYRNAEESYANMIARSKLRNGTKDCSPDINNRRCLVDIKATQQKLNKESVAVLESNFDPPPYYYQSTFVNY